MNKFEKYVDSHIWAQFVCAVVAVGIIYLFAIVILSL